MKTSRRFTPLLSFMGIALAACLAIVVSPPELLGEELHCQNCAPVLGIPGPTGIEDGHLFGGGGDALMDCHAFNGCHTFWQPGSCTRWHYFCQSGPHALRQVKEAAEAGSLSSIKLLAASRPSLIEITDDGYALVRDCDGHTLLGAIKLPNDDGEVAVHGFSIVMPSVSLDVNVVS